MNKIGFVDILNYEGMYMVNRKGEVMRIKGSEKCKADRRVAHCASYGDYQYVSLFKDNIRKNHKIHRLVATAFIPNPENKPTVNHIDGNKRNNHVSNLEWATTSENISHSYRTGLHRKGASHPQAKPIIQMDLNGCVIKEWGAINEAVRALGIKKQGITACCKNIGSKKYQTAYGYKWKYKQ